MAGESLLYWAVAVANAVLAIRIAGGLAPEKRLKKGIRLLFGAAFLLILLTPLPALLSSLSAAPAETEPPAETESAAAVRSQVLSLLCESVEGQLEQKLTTTGLSGCSVSVRCQENDEGQWAISFVAVTKNGWTEAEQRQAETLLYEKTGCWPALRDSGDG